MEKPISLAKIIMRHIIGKIDQDITTRIDASRMG